mmetsp:Transcript_57994/g.172405  ORF Transcript_57994/g.172405 Transcript_57994/m.172405 type:complete len:251 (+) Transcript_57994:114-866(+)
MNTSSTPRAHNSRHRIARTRRAITVDMLLSETSQSQWISNTGPTPCRWDGTSGRKRHETGEADSCIPPPMPRVASGHRRVGASIGCVSIVAEHALERRLEWQVDALHREAEKLLLVDHAVLRLVKLVEEGVGGGGVGERARDVVHVALQLVAHLLGLLHEESAHLHRVEVAAAVFVELFPHVLRHVVRHTRREVLEALQASKEEAHSRRARVHPAGRSVIQRAIPPLFRLAAARVGSATAALQQRGAKGA